MNSPRKISPPRGRPHAFFDLDYTLIPYDTLLLLSNYVIRKNPLRLFYLLLFLPITPLAFLKILDSGQTKRVFLSFLAGMKRERLLKLSRSFVEEVAAPLLYPEMVAELERHKQEGHVVVLNTASPLFYIQYLAEHLGVDHVYATHVEVPDRMPLIPVIQGRNNKRTVKIHAMEGILPAELNDAYQGIPSHPAPHELPALIMEKTHSYTDSAADFPLMMIAEQGTLVRPRSHLLQEVGEKRGWQVVTPPWPYKNRLHWVLSLLLMLVGLYRPPARYLAQR